jgi:hypothetical protein
MGARPDEPAAVASQSGSRHVTALDEQHEWKFS